VARRQASARNMPRSSVHAEGDEVRPVHGVPSCRSACAKAQNQNTESEGERAMKTKPPCPAITRAAEAADELTRAGLSPHDAAAIVCDAFGVGVESVRMRLRRERIKTNRRNEERAQMAQKKV